VLGVLRLKVLDGTTLSVVGFDGLLGYFYHGEPPALDVADSTALLALLDYFGLQEVPEFQRVHQKLIQKLQSTIEIMEGAE